MNDICNHTDPLQLNKSKHQLDNIKMNNQKIQMNNVT